MAGQDPGKELLEIFHCRDALARKNLIFCRKKLSQGPHRPAPTYIPAKCTNSSLSPQITCQTVEIPRHSEEKVILIPRRGSWQDKKPIFFNHDILGWPRQTLLREIIAAP